jgi:hypothetical protein
MLIPKLDNSKINYMNHPITNATPIFTTSQGVHIYELTPTDFTASKDAKFYYANYILWQQLNLGAKPIESRALYKEIIEVANTSIPAQEKVNKISTIAYRLLTHDAITFSRSLILSVCSQFFYTDKCNPKEEPNDNIPNAIIADAAAYAFFLKRLEPLLKNFLTISKASIQSLIERSDKAVNLVLKELDKK